MNRKVLSFVLAFSMTLGALFAAGPVQSVAADQGFNTARYGDTLDIGPKLRALEKDPEYLKKLDEKIRQQAKHINFNEAAASAVEQSGNPFTYNGGTKYFLGYDNIYGTYLKKYTLRSLGEKVEVWVANDLGFYSPDGNPDPYGRPAHVVTQEQVDQLRNEFDTKIYAKDTEFFGMPDAHSGQDATLPAMVGLPQNYYLPADGQERVILLVDNCRDENYYDPTYPFYVAGFYSSSFERYCDRNIINIDSNNWAKRIPDNGVFGTIAHEFQHLIHDDNDSKEETWINEGMSDFAEYLCGYDSYKGHVNYFIDHPENSLVWWDEFYDASTGPETLADYGQAFLLQLYLSDHFGKDFVKALAKEPTQGITSLNHVLQQFGTGIDFGELFRRFTIAVAIDSREPGNGIYNFDSIDLHVNYTAALSHDKDGVPAWGADYKVVNQANRIQNVNIDGIQYLPTPWKVVNDPKKAGNSVLWGNNGDYRDNRIVLSADLTPVKAAVLKFDNFIDIEESWDAGMVQVSVDGGKSWTSLSNSNTVGQEDFPFNEQAPEIYNNLPGFTGHYQNWTRETFDLTAFAGKKILISFRYMTDGAYNDTGWFIDNIEIPEIGYSNDCSTLDKFMSLDEVLGIDVKYSVTFINEKSMGKGNNKPHYRVLNLNPVSVSEADAIQLKDFFSGGNNYMIVWYAAPVGVKDPAAFTYTITTKNEHNKNKDKKK